MVLCHNHLVVLLPGSGWQEYPEGIDTQDSSGKRVDKGEKRGHDGERPRPGCAPQQADSRHKAKQSSTDEKGSDDRHEPGRVKKWEYVDFVRAVVYARPMSKGSCKKSDRHAPMEQYPQAV